jgi:hypothetical protein
MHQTIDRLFYYVPVQVRVVPVSPVSSPDLFPPFGDVRAGKKTAGVNELVRSPSGRCPPSKFIDVPADK